MNYSELSTALQEYLQTSESTFVASIPTFVKQAEERIFREVVISTMRKSSTGTLTAGTNTIAKPSDFLVSYSLVVTDSGSYVTVLKTDRSLMQEAFPSTTQQGVPQFYANSDETTLILGPTPDSNYAYELTYYYDPPSIVTASTSWLGDNASTVLLNACLVEAYTFLKGSPDLMQTYESRYENGMNGLKQLGLVMERRDDYRDGERGAA